MNSFAQSEIFFAVSSFGFLVLAILTATLIILCIKGVASVNRVLGKIETNIDNIGDATKELIEDVRDTSIFRLLFRPKKNKTARVIKK